jgi:hypothetical protein
MRCSDCKYLERVFELSLERYVAACAAAFYRVSTEFAARKNVDMERAKNDLEEHRRLCASVEEVRFAEPRVTRCFGIKAMRWAYNGST